MAPVRFIYFDLGNVLLKFSVRRLLHQTAELLEIDEQRVRAVMFENKRYQDLESGRITGREYFHSLCEGFGKPIPLEPFLEATNNIFWVNETLLRIARHLSKKFFPRGILSNVGPNHWTYVHEAFPRIWELFPQHQIASFEAGCMKPFPEIYQIAYRSACEEVRGIKPEEILLIDDLAENIAAAEAAGWQGVVYEQDDALVAALKEKGIPVPEIPESPMGENG
ncbi:MAG: HAD-IA family hydrolase [Thermoguttaceae bacterium]|nr:HAD-IA family hydrolase [Thermoguttaceae bacterium]MBQ3332117.1 HAD-IA family hydrolase [Thermoguttaceae bacterium]MBQ6618671.1 HAD-IA family hydrolase [Thermoguttaceae bacterium]